MRYKYARDRLAGYLQSLEKAGIEVDNDLIVQLQEVNFDMAVSAAAATKAASRVGLSVPKDIVVVGFVRNMYLETELSVIPTNLKSVDITERSLN